MGSVVSSSQACAIAAAEGSSGSVGPQISRDRDRITLFSCALSQCWFVHALAYRANSRFRPYQIARRALAAGAAVLVVCLIVSTGNADDVAMHRFGSMAEAAASTTAATKEAAVAAVAPGPAAAGKLTKLQEGETEGEKAINLKVQYKQQSAEDQEYEKDREKFAKEHPEEATKIHLKRKAERQAALREEYHKKRGLSPLFAHLLPNIGIILIGLSALAAQSPLALNAGFARRRGDA